MERTKLGVSTGLLAFIAYVLAGYSGLWTVLLLMFYVLTYESDRNLRINVVQATVLSTLFSVFFFFLSGISDLIDMSIVGRISIYSALYTILSLIEVFVFLFAAIRALKGEVMAVPIATEMVKKHFDESNEDIS